jgi:hypothetical protein
VQSRIELDHNTLHAPDAWRLDNRLVRAGLRVLVRGQRADVDGEVKDVL